MIIRDLKVFLDIWSEVVKDERVMPVIVRVEEENSEE